MFLHLISRRSYEGCCGPRKLTESRTSAHVEWVMLACVTSPMIRRWIHLFLLCSHISFICTCGEKCSTFGQQQSRKVEMNLQEVRDLLRWILFFQALLSFLVHCGADTSDVLSLNLEWVRLFPCVRKAVGFRAPHQERARPGCSQL